MKNSLLLLFGLVYFASCIPAENKLLTEVQLDYNSKQLQKIYDFQDKGQSDSLYTYFQNEDPTYRYAAAMAFASTKDAKGLTDLRPLLKDPIEDVRTAAAYAIGQIGKELGQSALVENFEGYDTLKMYRNSNAAILEAIGKCGDEENLAFLANIQSYTPQDTLLLEGQAYAIYRFALRDITSKAGTARMVELATNRSYPTSVRFIAANYLQRAKKIKIEEQAQAIGQAMQTDEDARIRMALALALGKTKTPEALGALKFQLSTERDYRVKCNIIRALNNFEYLEIKPLVEPFLNDKNEHVSLLAAQFFLKNGNSRDATLYQRKSRDSLHWRTKLALLSAANRHCPTYFTNTKNRINFEIRQLFDNDPNPYVKAEAVRALAESPWNFRLIKEIAFPSDSKVVRTASIEALAKIIRRPDFRKYFGNSYWRNSLELTDYMVETMKTGDSGMMAVAGGLLAEKGLFFKETLDSLTFLDEALKKLNLPAELETYNEVLKASNYLKNENKDLYEAEYNHPIIWRNLKVIGDGKQVYITTTKGEIVLDLLPDAAPGTVANFIQLIKESFFDKKAFHRVVPNFVAQVGCPRGDGYGSLDFTIRSELPLMHYDKEGYVGMASAGNHTECSQFFITHSPTLHLDGNYTIFASVSKGMDVVHQLNVGDSIEKITIK